MAMIPTLSNSDEELLSPPDPDALLEKRRLEIKEEAEKAEKEEPVLTDEEELEVVDLINSGRKELTVDVELPKAGRLERTVEVFNRRILLRTLTINEELQVSEITKFYMGTDGYPRAYRTAVVAAAIRLINGKLLYEPINNPDYDAIIRKKFEILLEYYPLAVDQIYGEYRKMELELLALVEKLGKSSG